MNTPAISELTYPVHCHVCKYPAGAHPRNTSTMHGSPTFGGLWHCPEHADVDCGCHHGDWCNPGCKKAARNAKRKAANWYRS
jgi:hypothetical protein